MKLLQMQLLRWRIWEAVAYHGSTGRRIHCSPVYFRQPSVRGVVSLIRQGRCTLLEHSSSNSTTLECMISRTLAALSLEGARLRKANDGIELAHHDCWPCITQCTSERNAPRKTLRSLFHPVFRVHLVRQQFIYIVWYML